MNRLSALRAAVGLPTHAAGTPLRWLGKPGKLATTRRFIAEFRRVQAAGRSPLDRLLVAVGPHRVVWL